MRCVRQLVHGEGEAVVGAAHQIEEVSATDLVRPPHGDGAAPVEQVLHRVDDLDEPVGEPGQVAVLARLPGVLLINGGTGGG